MPLQCWFWINFNKYWNAPTVKFSRCSITKSYLTLNNLMDCSTPRFPVLHYPPKFAQTYVHWVSDTIQHLTHYHPFSSWPQFFPALRSFPMSQLFASGGKSIGVSVSASVLPMNIQGWFLSGLTDLISLQSQGPQETSPAPQFEYVALWTCYLMAKMTTVLRWEIHSGKSRWLSVIRRDLIRDGRRVTVKF